MRPFFFFALPLLAWLLFASAALALETFAVREVTPGLKGTGYTVVRGTQVEAFDVEILGVLEEAGPGGDLILVRVDGGAIEQTGGIAAGMSGSPVIVDGKLLGAIGYGFEMSDHRFGLVTPAEEMLAVMERARELAGASAAAASAAAASDAHAASGEIPRWVHVAASREEALHAARELGSGEWVAAPVATPLVVSGLGGRAMNRLRQAFSGFNLIPVQGAGRAPAGAEEAPFEAGSALGVQLMRGDIEVTAIGTVTAVDESGVFVAFGHPFLHKGDVRYFTTGAYVLHTIPSLSIPFKLAAPLAPVGTLTQDRAAAIAGHLGDLPPAVQLEVRALDADRGKETSLKAEVVRDPSLFATLAVVGVLEGVDRALDRIGAGTSKVSFTIEGDGLPEALTRRNMFYSSSDVAAASLGELWEALELIELNEFADPLFTRVAFTIEVNEARRTAVIEEARPAASSVAPGSVVDVHVRLRPYRQDPFELVVPLSIPEGIGEGPVSVSVRAGGGDFRAEVPTSLEEELEGEGPSGEEDETDEGPTRAESLDNLIREFLERARNNDLVLEFYPNEVEGRGRKESSGSQASEEDEEEEEPAEDGFFDEFDFEAGPEPVRSVHETDYVLQGEAYFTLIVEAKAEAGKEPGPAPEPAPERIEPEQRRGPQPLVEHPGGFSAGIRKAR